MPRSGTAHARIALCVHGVKNPIRRTRVVMEQFRMSWLTEDGAMAFLREHGACEFMPDAYLTRNTVWPIASGAGEGNPARLCRSRRRGCGE